MRTAYELPTPQREGVIRTAYRLDPPWVYREPDPETGHWIVREAEHIVISNGFSYVIALPGQLRRGRVEISEFIELAALSGTHRSRAMLTAMGYPALVDTNGRTTMAHAPLWGVDDRER